MIEYLTKHSSGRGDQVRRKRGKALGAPLTQVVMLMWQMVDFASTMSYTM